MTRTLASLADLRDRGAISPEDYEAKKADLLGAPVATARVGRPPELAAATMRGTPTHQVPRGS